jgi:predicted AAA+ superfamily ATPase
MNPEQCRNAFEVLFCTPDDSGVLKCSGGVLLHRLETFLRALCQNPAPAGNAAVADLLNALSKSVGEKSFASCWAGELFDALAGFNIFPDDLKNASGGSDEEFLLEKAWTISKFLRNFDIDQTGNDSGKLLPRCREIFKSLPQSKEELIELLKNSDPFSSGQVFCYRNNRFVPVVPVSVRKVDTFFGYPGVRAAYADHFREFACGKTNLPLLVNSLPGYGKTSMVISYALDQKNLIPILAEPDALEENWSPLIQTLARRKDHRFVVFFDDIDPAKVDWYSFRTNVGGAFAPPENVMPVLTANYEFPASILSRGRKISYPVFDELRCSEMIEDFLRSFGMQRPPANLVSLIGAEYAGEFGQKKFTELSPRTLIRYLKIYEHDQNKRRVMIELASGEMIPRPDPELFYEFNINLMRSLYGEEYIQKLLKEKLREL